MQRLSVILLALALTLVPWLSGVPDEPLWSSWLAALALLAGALAVVGRGNNAQPHFTPRGSTAVFGLLVAWALISATIILARQHSLAYAGLIGRGWATLAAALAVFLLARRAARTGTAHTWIVVGGLMAGAAICAAIGANEYAAHVRAGQADWRVFGTSTPDFLAGYLVMLLPTTVAAFLAVRAGVAAGLLLGLVAALELGVMLATGSRFALVSLVVGMASFGGTLAYAVRRDLALEEVTRRRLAGMGVVALVAAGMAAKPVLGRLLASHAADNSAAFRVWTWRGAARMALAHPVVGSGIGAWVQTYPRYALTGFTRLAHNGYLQMADECGFVGLALLLAALGLVIIAVMRALARATVPAPVAASAPLPARTKRGKPSLPPPLPQTDIAAPPVFPVDPRLLLCGLAGSLAAMMTQNIIDSDWSVFFILLTFWAIAGLAVGLAEPAAQTHVPNPARPVAGRVLLGSGAALLCACFACQGTAALWANVAHAAPTPREAETAYGLASTWDSLNAAYPAALGYQVYARENNLPMATAALRRAVLLQPDGVNYRRLGTVLLAQGRHAEAEGAWERGLSAEPHSLDLLLSLASITPPPSRLAYYRTVARLEQSPVGTVRAIGGIAEPKFAIADAALADAAPPGSAEALDFYTRAAAVLQDYAAQDGSVNPQRQAMHGGQTEPDLDTQMRDLYAHVSDKLVALATPAQRALLAQQRQTTLAQFDALLRPTPPLP